MLPNELPHDLKNYRAARADEPLGIWQLIPPDVAAACAIAAFVVYAMGVSFGWWPAQ